MRHNSSQVVRPSSRTDTLMRDIIRAVLAANEEFYRAFRERDMGALEDLWASRSPVACIHPGWDIMTDREEVLNSWRRILSSQDNVRIECRNTIPYLLNDIAIVLAHELLSGHTLTVTNMFRLEEGEWRMIHHHSSPMAVSGEDAEEQDPPTSTRRVH